MRTNLTNGYETTLTGSIEPTSVTIPVATTAGSPQVPFYLVIDPTSDANREIILVNQSKTGTSFSLTTSGFRGRDGTSARSHQAGTRIGLYPVAALFSDLWNVVEGDTDLSHSSLSGRSALGSHPISAITNLTSELASKAPADHDHAAYDLLRSGRWVEITSQSPASGSTATVALQTGSNPGQYRRLRAVAIGSCTGSVEVAVLRSGQAATVAFRTSQYPGTGSGDKILDVSVDGRIPSRALVTVVGEAGGTGFAGTRTVSVTSAVSGVRFVGDTSFTSVNGATPHFRLEGLID